jgi:hypothetical protein
MMIPELVDWEWANFCRNVELEQAKKASSDIQELLCFVFL